MNSQSHRQSSNEKTSSKPKYVITAKFKSGILSIQVVDATTNKKWRSDFTQKSFPLQNIFDIASGLVDAINSIHCQKKPLIISQYQRWCYVSVKGANLPTFALRPDLVQYLQLSQKKRRKVTV
mmetsp:Transcript_44163/g.70766  ORF Transcript_44163/g.70766 Transcript_44163/m.70766 type:complete len:123 (-) Transcript_44163:356-724(-)